jgi:acetyl-CoA acyltransferase 2
MVFARVVKGVFIVAAKRTPFGTYGGKLMNFSATDLQEVAFRAALTAGNVKPEWVDSVIVGNVFHAASDGAYLPRHASLRVGVRTEVPALAVNRMCGSGFQSVVTGSQEIMLGDAKIVLTGGAENMSLSPHAVRGIRFGVRLGVDVVMEDTLWAGLTDQQIKMAMGITAENLAEKYGISRLQCDEFAFRSVQLWKKANDAGYFKAEMAPVTIKTKKGTETVEVDEHPKPQTTVETLSKLPPVFKKGGTVDAGNASGICDGAGSVILASEEAIKQYGLKPLARVTGYGIAGCDPTIMGIGPVPAIEALLKTTGHALKDIDLIEVNEAFAPQTLAVQKALGIDNNQLNLNGGAIALGHPVGASGSRITAHLTHELIRRKAKTAIGSACIGGGQGIAVLLEPM